MVQYVMDMLNNHFLLILVVLAVSSLGFIGFGWFVMAGPNQKIICAMCMKKRPMGGKPCPHCGASQRP